MLFQKVTGVRMPCTSLCFLKRLGGLLRRSPKDNDAGPSNLSVLLKDFFGSSSFDAERLYV